jgi:hypothetical protein
MHATPVASVPAAEGPRAGAEPTVQATEAPVQATEAPVQANEAPVQATTSLPVLDHAVRARALHVPRLPPGAYLGIEDGGDISVIPLEGDIVRLGRAFSADLRLENPTVSRRHAILSREDGRWVLLDDRSANGSWVDGERVTRAVLRDGARLRLGTVAMSFLLVEAAAA